MNIIFSDIDGTLLNSKKEVSPLILRAIHQIQEQGDLFVLVSARSPSGIQPILNSYHFNCPLITFSGALILDEHQEVIYSSPLLKKQAKEIVDFIHAHHFDIALNYYVDNEWVVENKLDTRNMREASIVKIDPLEGTLDSLTKPYVHKILCICNSKEIDSLQKKIKNAFPMFSVVQSSPVLIEIMNQGVNKAKGIQVFLEKKQLSNQQTFAFGDQENDIEMLKSVKKGFLMKNAPDYIKKIGFEMTSSNDEDGIYQALRKIKII